jgi:hypothetical protein
MAWDPIMENISMDRQNVVIERVHPISNIMKKIIVCVEEKIIQFRIMI